VQASKIFLIAVLHTFHGARPLFGLLVHLSTLRLKQELLEQLDRELVH
jgi:hypothetical protein